MKRSRRILGLVSAGTALSLVTIGVTATASASADPTTTTVAAITSAIPDLGDLAGTVDWTAAATAAANTAAAASGNGQATASTPNVTGDAITDKAVTAPVREGVNLIAGALPPDAIVPGSKGTDGMLTGSTAPRCAATVITAVPGTFETGPTADPNAPVGLLAQVVEPLTAALGNQVSATFIPYASDASVNGTSYLRSVSTGVQATLATMEDVANRCPEAQQILLGFSQGAEIGGDVATAIGQRRTSINPDSVVAVGLFSDPKRPETSNVLADTTQTQPALPTSLQEKIKEIVESPSFAQMQLQLTDGFRSLVNQVATQVSDTGRAVADATAPTSSTQKSTTTTTTHAAVPDSDSQAVATTTAPEETASVAGSSTNSAETTTKRPAAGQSGSTTTSHSPTTTSSSKSSSAESPGAASTRAPSVTDDPLMQPLDDGTNRDGINNAPAAKPSTSPKAPTTSKAAPSSSKTAAAGSETNNTADGGLASNFAKSLAGDGVKPEARIAVNVNENRKVDVAPVTMGAVSGGGLSGQRDSDFGALSGVVAEICVPGDVVCSLPENSELARQLVQVGKNVSGNLGELATVDGANRMVGLLSLQAVNTVADITGMPRSKLSAETLQSMVEMIAGSAMTSMGNPAGAALLAKGVSALPNALPEVFAQIADIPAILAQLPNAGDTAMKNLGLDKVVDRISQAFAEAGMTSPLQFDKLPIAIPRVLEALAQDNQGLLQLATNPAVHSGNSLHVAFDTIQIAGNQDPYQWVDDWFKRISVTA
ncbi:cutinase family protein [Rhodococcus qingshengii]|uniref:cutinase family protein n=1 Tax=Rhodococcus qingshengii TaxID=334542 RepID=UPI00071C8C6B|nr:cutinase family protein [Rhodococcus qingshengii]KSU67435.1 hypothetical protein AS032_31545 [Rhodococcus qingshengii]SCC69394.1 Cutinase [Rhodococcus qingshengii]